MRTGRPPSDPAAVSTARTRSRNPKAKAAERAVAAMRERGTVVQAESVEGARVFSLFGSEIPEQKQEQTPVGPSIALAFYRRPA